MMWHRTVGSIHFSRPSCCYWGLNDPFRSMKLPALFNGSNNSPKLPFPPRDPRLIHGFLDPPKSPHLSKRHLDQFSRFCRAHLCVQQTDRKTTLRATSAAIGRIYAMHVMQLIIHQTTSRFSITDITLSCNLGRLIKFFTALITTASIESQEYQVCMAED